MCVSPSLCVGQNVNIQTLTDCNYLRSRCFLDHWFPKLVAVVVVDFCTCSWTTAAVAVLKLKNFDQVFDHNKIFSVFHVCVCVFVVSASCPSNDSHTPCDGLSERKRIHSFWRQVSWSKLTLSINLVRMCAHTWIWKGSGRIYFCRNTIAWVLLWVYLHSKGGESKREREGENLPSVSIHRQEGKSRCVGEDKFR